MMKQDFEKHITYIKWFCKEQLKYSAGSVGQTCQKKNIKLKSIAKVTKLAQMIMLCN